MDINTANTIRDILNATSLAVLFLVIGVALIGLFRPKALKFVFKEFANRKYIAVGGVFLGFLCGTIYTATQADYSSYNNTSQDRSAVQSQTSMPEDKNEDAKEAEVQGAHSDEENSGQATSSTSTERLPQSTRPNPPQTRGQDKGNTKNDAQQASDQSKSDKNCRITQLLFVCI